MKGQYKRTYGRKWWVFPRESLFEQRRNLLTLVPASDYQIALAGDWVEALGGGGD